jgi:hypothetical protein
MACPFVIPFDCPIYSQAMTRAVVGALQRFRSNDCASVWQQGHFREGLRLFCFCSALENKSAHSLAARVNGCDKMPISHFTRQASFFFLDRGGAYAKGFDTIGQVLRLLASNCE